VLFSFACAGAHRSPPPASQPRPTTPTGATQSASDSAGQGPWAFTYTAGVRTYAVHRTATIRPTDSTSNQEVISANSTHEILTVEVRPQGTAITAVIDSFIPVAPESAARVQSNQLPTQLSGLLANGVLTIGNDVPSTDSCSQIQSILIADLRNLAVPLPDSLTHGFSWKDSVAFKGCQVGIPTLIQITRSFLVIGEVPYDGHRVLEIARTDSAHMDAEGGLQQHHVLVHAVGTGTGTYYVDVGVGQIIRLSTDQLLNIEVATVRNKSRFRQTATQEFVLIP
jgi:hypothetical protein